MKYFWVRNGGLIIFVSIIIGLTVGVGFAIQADMERSRRLMVECMSDGKKEYECVAMLKSDVVPIPVVIPISTGR